MKYRIISAMVGIAVFIPIIVFSDTLLLPIAAAFFACIAVLELYRCIGGGRKLSYLAISLYDTVWDSYKDDPEGSDA
ncbi:MAG: hypothetical protein J6R89_00050, partial [Clostridia bacterium]|nr:hypothetical protein [Clostridia bacterium]